MSDKHLNAQSWTKFAADHKVDGTKAAKVTKALEGLANCAEGDTEARIKALAAVKTEAKALQQPKGNQEVEKYLGEMLAEVKKNQGAPELVKKESKEKLPVKAEVKPQGKVQIGKPTASSGVQPEQQGEVKPKVQIGRKLPVEAKPEPQGEVKPKVQIGRKLPVEAKPEPQGEVKPKVQIGRKLPVEAKPEPQGEVKPKVQIGRKPVEAKPEEEKKGAREKEEKEEAGDPIPRNVEFKGVLTGAMAKVKARKPTDPPMGAMLCQLGNQFGVFLSGNVGSGQQNLLKQVLKGTGHNFAKGTCEWGEGDIYTFVLPNPLAGAARGLKQFFLRWTGVGYKIRVGPKDGAMEEDLTEVKPNPLRISMNVAKEWNAGKAAAEKQIASLKAAILQQCDPGLETQVKAKIDVWDSILGLVDDKFLKQLTATALAESEEENQTQHAGKAAKVVTDLATALNQHPLATVADNNPFGKFFIRGALNRMLTRVQAIFNGGA